MPVMTYRDALKSAMAEEMERDESVVLLGEDIGLYGGTHLVMTEPGAYLDGYDDAGSRERGTQHLLDALGASLTD